MSWPKQERQEAEAAIATAYDAMTDLIDVAIDADDDEMQHAAANIQDQINSLYRRLP